MKVTLWIFTGIKGDVPPFLGYDASQLSSKKFK